MMNNNRIRNALDAVRPEPGAKERICERLEAELGKPLEDCPVSIKPRSDSIPRPLDGERIRFEIEAELGKPLRDVAVTVRPRRGRISKLLAAAAMLAVVIGSAALLFWPLLRPEAGRIDEPEYQIDPTASPEPTLFETPEPSPEPEPTPSFELGTIVDEGTVTAENGNILSWALDENGLLLIRGSGAMEDFLGNYGWQSSYSDQYPWTGYLTSVRTLIVEPGLSSIGERAFLDFRYLTKAVIPESVTSIGDRAFYECTELEEVSIPEGLLAIGDRAFFDCKSLKNITIPPAVTSIGTKAFSHCPLSSVEIPGSVAGVREYAFEYCQSLYSVRIGEGVRTIGDYAFYLCEDMTVIAIPASVTEIGTGAFVGCGSLFEVYFAGSEEQWRQIVIGSGNDNLRNAEINYETIPESLSAEDLPSRELGTIVDEGSAVAENGETLSWALDRKGLLLISGSGEMEDFYPFLHYKSFDVSTGSIKEYSGASYPWLKHLDSIRAVIIEPGLRSIGASAFQNMRGLTSVEIPETVTAIGDGAFSNCGLESVTIPEGVETIGEYAFSNCSSLKSVSISDNVTSVGEWAFSFTGLESVTIPGGVEVIGDSAFKNCRSLKSVTIMDGVREIRMNAFFYCDSLAELSIPGSVTEIGHGAFYWCSSLESVTIPEGVTEIQDECFGYCTALKNVWLPASLSKVSYSLFENCVSLSDIYYAGSEEHWDQIMEAYAKGLLDYVTIHFNSEA